jgi:hypothetical protein
MGEYVQEKYALRPVIHPRNQPIGISLDIEHSATTDLIGMRVDELQIGE